MNKNRFINKISLFMIFFATVLLLFTGNFSASAYTIGDAPVGISVSYYDDIDSRGFAWQTSTNVTETLLLVKPESSNEDWSGITPITGKYDDLNGFRCHRAQVTDLQPGNYLYKVGGNGKFSEVGKFTIDNSNDNKVTFSYVTDSQETSVAGFENFNKTLKTAVTHNPNFIMFAGDLVDNSHASWGSDLTKIVMEEWVYCYDTTKEITMNYPMMSAAGNHERAGYSFVYHNNINYDHEASTGGYYSFDYENLHVTVLDSNCFEDGDEEAIAAQVEWLKNDLANTQKQWKVVMLHIGAYSTGDHSNDSSAQRIRDMLPPIFAQYKVDLVLQGHDHVYTRTLPYYYGEGENGKIPNRDEVFIKEDGINWSQEPDGTYYITINYAGTKSYPPVDYDTSRIFPAKSPVNGKVMSQHVLNRMFANIEIDGDRLLMKSYLAKDDGSEELYDYVAIQKNTYNTFSNNVKSVSEKTELTISDAPTINALKKSFENLSPRALTYVSAETIAKYNEILSSYNLEDNLAAYNVIESINKLDTTDYSGDFLANYKEACTGYYSLTETQKALVSNTELLLSIDGKLTQIKDEMTKRYLIEGVQKLVDAIPTAENKAEAIFVAKAAYDLLDDESKQSVLNIENFNIKVDPVVDPEIENEKGCNGSIYAPVTSVLLLGCVIILSRRKRGDYNEEN